MLVHQKLLDDDDNYDDDEVHHQTLYPVQLVIYNHSQVTHSYQIHVVPMVVAVVQVDQVVV